MNIENKISKICWNSEGWKFPSGSKGKSVVSESYETKYGFGHEEWLFDKSRMIDGYHYAFLQPLNLKTDKHVAKFIIFHCLQLLTARNILSEKLKMLNAFQEKNQEKYMKSINNRDG